MGSGNPCSELSWSAGCCPSQIALGVGLRTRGSWRMSQFALGINSPWAGEVRRGEARSSCKSGQPGGGPVADHCYPSLHTCPTARCQARAKRPHPFTSFPLRLCLIFMLFSPVFHHDSNAHPVNMLSLGVAEKAPLLENVPKESEGSSPSCPCPRGSFPSVSLLNESRIFH